MAAIGETKLKAIIRAAEGDHDTGFTIQERKCSPFSILPGMTTRDIKAHLEKIYGIEVSPELVSRVTDAVMDEVREWQTRQLDSSYPIVYLDALRVNGRTDGKTCNNALYTALGVNFQGKKDVLGFWIADTEGAKFWMNVLNELKNRGVEDILIACTDGLTGFPDAIRAVYPCQHR